MAAARARKSPLGLSCTPVSFWKLKREIPSMAAAKPVKKRRPGFSPFMKSQSKRLVKNGATEMIILTLAAWVRVSAKFSMRK